MMKYLIVISLFATACTDVPLNGPHYNSVRERLSAAPTSLFVHDEASSGAITARRRGSDEWIVGTTGVTIERGYVRAGIDANGQLEIDQLEVALAPITLDGVFAKPAVLQDVVLRLAEGVHSEATWASPDAARATLQMELAFDWAIAIDGGEPYPLASQRMPLQHVDVVLTGDGDHVDAFIDVDAAGELWNWADIVQITALDLSLTAATAD
jgi:hypothetical protein